MKTCLIATWRMALDGIILAKEYLDSNDDLIKAMEIAVKDVENNPKYISVGYGGLPNKEGFMELDAGVMDGKTLNFGAVSGVRNYKNPFSIAKDLIKREHSNFLIGDGAEIFAKFMGYNEEDILSKKAKERYEENKNTKKINPYDGHDTVGMVFFKNNHIVSGTSTSGLFMKEVGRVGDSPIVGSGYYSLDGIGGAAATGMGEDILKVCLSFDVVRNIEAGMDAMKACKEAILRANKLLKNKRDMSVVAIDKNGNFGAYTNAKHFSFVVFDGEFKVYLMSFDGKDCDLKVADEKWIRENLE